jgi:hypothetical protein
MVNEFTFFVGSSLGILQNGLGVVGAYLMDADVAIRALPDCGFLLCILEEADGDRQVDLHWTESEGYQVFIDNALNPDPPSHNIDFG